MRSYPYHLPIYTSSARMVMNACAHDIATYHAQVTWRRTDAPVQPTPLRPVRDCRGGIRPSLLDPVRALAANVRPLLEDKRYSTAGGMP